MNDWIVKYWNGYQLCEKRVSMVSDVRAVIDYVAGTHGVPTQCIISIERVPAVMY